MTVAYRYRAARAAGDLVEGELRAGSPAEAMEQLRRQSLVPVRVDPAPAPRLRRRFSAASSASLRVLATLLSAGQTLDRALAFASVQSADPSESAAWEGVRQGVRDGASLSDAMGAQSHFSAFAVAVIRAGEESGRLDTALATVAQHEEHRLETARRIRAALLYPALMGAVSAAGVLVVLTIAVPRFMAMLDVTGGTLPWTTRLLVGTSHLVVGGWWLWLPLLAGVTVAIRSMLVTPAYRARWHAVRLRIPVSGPLERDMAAARFCRAFGILIGAGVPMLAALRLARGVVTNDSLGSALEHGAAAVARGDGVAASVGPVLPSLAAQLLEAGEHSGQLDEMCARSADALDMSVATQLRTMVRLIEPVLIVTFGGVVGFVALAMLQAMYAMG